MAKKTKKMTLEKLQKEVHFLRISIPYDSREEYCLLEFSNSEEGELEKSLAPSSQSHLQFVIIATRHKRISNT